ncbi:MAG: hypothetical protein LUD19_02895 [Clostridia bacterium]|nr:hypothetical protein [Clostridia bacterium]
MNYKDLEQVQKKYGSGCSLTKDNIKDIYFLTDCNTRSGGDSAITQFIEKHYPPDDILSWNNEFVNAKLDESSTKSGWERIAETGWNLQIACGIYANEQVTIKKLIGKLQSFYNQYGYFMNYYFLKKIPTYPYEDKTFNSFEDIYISEKGGRALYGFADERRYLADDGFCGLIPRLYKLNYSILLNELLTDVFLPVLTQFEEFLNDTVTDVMKEHGIIYLQRDITDICDYPVRRLFKRYAGDNSIILPTQFKKVLADYPLTEQNAREYFFKCKCSLSKIYGRNDDNAKKFASYNIGRQTLDGWTNEWISCLLAEGSVTAEKLLYIVQNFSGVTDGANALKMIKIYNGIKGVTDSSIRHALLYNVEINRLTGTVCHYGLLYIAAKNGLKDCLNGLESELYPLIDTDDLEAIKGCIKAMYKECMV